MPEKKTPKSACVSRDASAGISATYILMLALAVVGTIIGIAGGAFTADYWIVDNWEMITVFIISITGIVFATIFLIMSFTRKCK